MIYFDNAATSWPKPSMVSDAVAEALQKAGNPGRGAHESAAWAAQKIYSVREKLAELFQIKDPLRIAFTQNATHALNIAVNLCFGEILTTSMEHNSVLRPVFDRGFYNIVKASADGFLRAEDVISKISDITGAVVVTHASNVTGTVYDIEKIGAVCRNRRILFVVDASQTAGTVPIDVERMQIDVLCFSGHKSLLGPQGTGGIYVREGIPIRPFMLGGTGSKSFDPVQPKEMPECFEAGTMNTHGIAGLGAGIDFIRRTGMDVIAQKEAMLRDYFVKEVSKLGTYKIFGRKDVAATATVSITKGDMDSMLLAEQLSDAGIAVRGGFHCAPLAHRTLGTEKTGTVRFGFGFFNTRAEIDAAVAVLRRL